MAQAISSTRPVAAASIRSAGPERAAALFSRNEVTRVSELDAQRPPSLICGTVEDRAHLGRGLLG